MSGPYFGEPRSPGPRTPINRGLPPDTGKFLLSAKRVNIGETTEVTRNNLFLLKQVMGPRSPGHQLNPALDHVRVATPGRSVSTEADMPLIYWHHWRDI
jgi:hypothetical protein